jgi:hypothetical protein
MKDIRKSADVSELGEIEYGILKETYCRLNDLRSQVSAIHDKFLTEGIAPDFDQVDAIYIATEELYGELERFLLPLCAEEESCGIAMCMH